MVIGIIAVLAAILFPIFASAKAAAKKVNCISNLSEVQKALQLYVADADGQYPQTRTTSASPEVSDADGSQEEPDSGPVFARLESYLAHSKEILNCPMDPDPSALDCVRANPDLPEIRSYLYNGAFAFGLKESQLKRPSETVIFAERRSQTISEVPPFCSYMYRPWFSLSKSKAPEDDMNPKVGAIATQRHNGVSVFAFTDGHVGSMPFSLTFSLAAGVNLHLP